MKKLLLPLLIVMGTIAFAQDVKPQWNHILSGSSETLKTQLAVSSESGISITALSKPSMAGTISGSGDYEYGSTCTLTAIPATDFQFVNWTNNGVIVSTSATYTFNVIEAGTYVANFCTVQSSDVTIGSGTSTNSYLPTYSYYKYAFTEQIYTAEEIGGEGAISAISFKVSNGKSTTRNVDFYIKATTKTTFSSKSDWETFSVSDRVYSGEVTFNASGWTTITFSTPFVYDGTSNVVIGMDDNSATYVSSSSNSPKFYVYSTGANRALRIYGDNTNYSPLAPSGYTGSYITSNDQIVLAMHSTVDPDVEYYEIMATADPREGGTVLGEGTYEEGSIVTLEAIANDGYNFVSWTKEDEVVSTDAIYTFTVTADEEYLAVFEEVIAPTYDINVALVDNGVIETDMRSAAAGDIVTLTATPNSGCYFSHWIVYKSGDINDPVSVNNDQFVMPNADVTVAALFVASSSSFTTLDIPIGSGNSTNAYLPTYSYYRYSFTEQIYTADEIGQAGTITAIAYRVSNSRSATRNVDLYLKTTTKNIFTNKSNWEPFATTDKYFSGEVTFDASGWTVITLNTPFVYDGTSNLLVGMDDNTGGYVSGGSSNSPKFYVYTTGANRAIRVYSDNTNYNPTSPSSYNGTTVTSNNQIVLTMKTQENGTTYSASLFVTPRELSDFNYTYGNGPSEAQSFAVVGANLSDAVTVTAPRDYEISTTIDGNYSSSLTFTGERGRGILTWDFEDGFDGWTTIDADGDGHGWMQSSALMSGYVLNAHSGGDMLSSESYYKAMQQPLNPDNWLVSPEVLLGGTFSMYACAQDTNYAEEHFGIFLSLTSNSDVESFVKLDEWTISYGNNRAITPWYVYAVDLSAYAGQSGYIAVRHYNCYDQFYLNVDDFSLTYDDNQVIPDPIPVHLDYLATNVYVRLKAGLSQGSYNESITVTCGDITKTIDLDGLVTGRRDLVESKPLDRVKAIQVYPNPVNRGESIRIAIPEACDMDDAKIEIYNELGVMVYSERFTGNDIDNHFAAGLYTVRVVDANDNVHYSKLIVK